MSKSLTVRQRTLQLFAPLLVIFIGYAVAFHRPLERELGQRLAKQHKLESALTHRSGELEIASEQLAALQTEERSLALELEKSKQIGAKLVTRRSDLRAELFHTTSPASLVAQALQLLARHRLECLDSSPIAPAASAGGSLKSLKPVAELLGGSSAEEGSRHTVRIKLAGRFEDMHGAVREMGRKLPEIFTVSLDMEDADGHTDRRIWILTISV